MKAIKKFESFDDEDIELYDLRTEYHKEDPKDITLYQCQIEDGESVYVVYDQGGEIVMEGDGYHNHIHSKMDGFVKGIKYTGKTVEVKQFYLNEIEKLRSRKSRYSTDYIIPDSLNDFLLEELVLLVNKGKGQEFLGYLKELSVLRGFGVSKRRLESALDLVDESINVDEIKFLYIQYDKEL